MRHPTLITSTVLYNLLSLSTGRRALCKISKPTITLHLISEYYAIRGVFKMATLSITHFLIVDTSYRNPSNCFGVCLDVTRGCIYESSFLERSIQVPAKQADAERRCTLRIREHDFPP